MKKITPLVIEFLHESNKQIKPHLGVIIEQDRNKCSTLLGNGHIIEHGFTNVRLVISNSDQLLESIKTNPLHPPGLTTKTISKLEKIPELLGAIKYLETNTLYRNYSQKLRNLEFTKSRYTLQELSELCKDDSDNEILSKWASYQSVLKASNMFKIVENPLNGLEIEVLSMELIDLYQKIGSKEKEIMEFIGKCLEKTESSWTEFELEIIELLKRAVISSKKFPDIEKNISWDILKKTDIYQPDLSNLIIFLKEKGLVAPWESFMQRFSGLKRIANVFIAKEAEITKTFDDQYTKLIEKAESKSLDDISKEDVVEKFPWLTPDFIPYGKINDTITKDLCSNLRKDFGDLPGRNLKS